MDKTELFWSILRQFKEDTLLVQILLVGASLLALYGVVTKPSPKSNRMMTAFLTVAFAWNSIACFFIYCGKSPMALFVAGPLYLVIAFLLLIDLFVTKEITYRLPASPLHKGITVGLLTLVYLFPLAGMALGHGFVVLPMFPCPLAAFALILFAASAPNVDQAIVTLLLIWAFVNIPKCLGLYGCYEEIVLCASGFYTLYILKTTPHEDAATMGATHEPA